MGTGFAKKKKEANHLKQQLSSLQHMFSSKLEGVEAEGRAGNGLVSVVLSGSGEMKRIQIRPECVDPEDISGLEALIKAAHNQASHLLQESLQGATSCDGLSSLLG